MAENINGKQVFSLYEVTRSIQKTIENRYQSAYWIKAELNKLNYYQRSGHCFPELVEKKDGQTIAQIRSTLWNADYRRINQAFKSILNEPLKDGIKILMQASIHFHPEYGVSLRILDIDPSFTLGDLEREKQETIQALQAEKIFDKNKGLKLPLLPQRIAIISVETSKGYVDFMRVLEQAQNQWNYHFFHYLFPSLLQGDQAAKAILGQLKKIKSVLHYFDMVAIIRGGGGDIGLTCYNNYELAKEIANYPIPVLTGIGHATNETVTEMVAHTNAITPTQLAEIIVQHFHNFSVPVQGAQEKILEHAQQLLIMEKRSLQSAVQFFKSLTQLNLYSHQHLLKQNVQLLDFHAKSQLKHLKQELLNINKNVYNLSPERVLQRGFSITRINKQAITSVEQLQEGEVIETTVKDGTFISTVKSKEQKS